MDEKTYVTPLLKPDSPLDEHSKALITEIYKQEQAKALALPTDDPLDPKRRMRVDYTWTEMWEQPEILQKNLQLNKSEIAEAARLIASKQIDRVILTGCGDSISTMLAMRSLYEEVLGIPCEALQALDFAYYYYRPVNERTLVITLSSSGKTVRTVEAMLIARSQGALTLTLSNTAGSPLMVESSRGILIHAERKGWPTQSTTAAMALLYMLGIEIARQKGSTAKILDLYERQLLQMPELVSQVLQQNNDPILDLARTEAEKAIYLFAGGGSAYVCALIGAAKVKECSPDHAIAISSEEFHHYNSQKVGDPLILIAPKGPSVPRALDTVREGKRWGGQVYSIVTNGEHRLNQDSDRVYSLPEIYEVFTPLLYTIPVQLFAYHVAMEKFRLAEKAQNV